MTAIDNLSRLKHMYDATSEALAFVAGLDQQQVEPNRPLVLALVKEIEIIGEAASRVSLTLRDEYPDLPWAEIIGMRNRLVHAYFEIDFDIVWEVVTTDLPKLKQQLAYIIQNQEVG